MPQNDLSHNEDNASLKEYVLSYRFDWYFPTAHTFGCVSFWKTK